MLVCEGYQKLIAAVAADEARDGDRRSHNYRGHLSWIVARAKHYAEKTGLKAEDILDAWESHRTYWYMNYYQDANQPLIEADKIRIFETVDEMMASFGDAGFRCPHCEGISKSPYACDSGRKLKLLNSSVPEVCNWKIYGLFGHLGKGIHVFAKDKARGEAIFMPIAWELPRPEKSIEDDQAWIDPLRSPKAVAS